MYKTTLHHEHRKLNLKKKKSCAILGKNANDKLCIFPYIDEKYDYKERDIIRVENGGSRWKYRLITGEMLVRRFRDRLPRWQRLLPFYAMTYYRPWVTTSRSIYRWPAVNPIYESIYARYIGTVPIFIFENNPSVSELTTIRAIQQLLFGGLFTSVINGSVDRERILLEDLFSASFASTCPEWLNG